MSVHLRWGILYISTWNVPALLSVLDLLKQVFNVQAVLYRPHTMRKSEQVSVSSAHTAGCTLGSGVCCMMFKHTAVFVSRDGSQIVSEALSTGHTLACQVKNALLAPCQACTWLVMCTAQLAPPFTHINLPLVAVTYKAGSCP